MSKIRSKDAELSTDPCARRTGRRQRPKAVHKSHDKGESFTELFRAPFYIARVLKPIEGRSKMNFNRPGHRDDVLFVIAILVTAVVTGARYFESDRQMDQIARAHAQAVSIAVEGKAHAPMRVARADAPDR
jgi:hypothetical protein